MPALPPRPVRPSQPPDSSSPGIPSTLRSTAEGRGSWMSGRWMWRCRPPRHGSWGPLAPPRPRGCRCGDHQLGGWGWEAAGASGILNRSHMPRSRGHLWCPFQPAGDCLNMWGSWACTVPQEMVIRVDKIFGGRSKEKRKMKVGAQQEKRLIPAKAAEAVCISLPAATIGHVPSLSASPPWRPNAGRRGAAADRGARG